MAGPHLCKFCGERATAKTSYYSSCTPCHTFNCYVRRILQDLYKVDPQIVSDFKNLLSHWDKQQFFLNHHNLKKWDLTMQILQTVSEARKIRCIDRLSAKGKAVDEDDIRDKYADTDESMVKIH